ncbi:Transcriptional regulator of pyrimidine catabolism (TetR family) [hydrothermal vent metagenome]|uniref:Transcriptional regulator of pyrimidine catabolism (TetR family) n=1 Tax=hydrothermal vent metagenome TaxID=652676 RepID=A0A3B0SBA3_9ZZZZ
MKPPITTQPAKPKKNIREANVRRILAAAEEEFAQNGFKGATTDTIAKRAGVPKANLHYYFSTKAELYQQVIENVCEFWLAAAKPFDETDDPATAFSGYIRAKMDQARERPFGSRVWAMEVIRGAPVIDGYLHTVLKPWFEERTRKIENWINTGKMAPVDPHTLFYMIWATTQHYADFAHQINVLNEDKPLSEQRFAEAKNQVCQIILAGVGLE